MSTRLFTYTWVYEGRGEKKFRVELGRAKSTKKWTKYTTQKGFPAAILYPSLFTPDIMAEDVPDQRLELLLVIPNIQLTARPGLFNRSGWLTSLSQAEIQVNMSLFINRQLRIAEGLNPEKRYRYSGDLFPFIEEKDESKRAEYILDGHLIQCRMLGELKPETAYKTETRFEGYVDESAVTFYTEHEFTHVLSVSIDRRALDNVQELKPKEDPASTIPAICNNDEYEGSQSSTEWLKPLPRTKWNPDYLVYRKVRNNEKSMNLGRYGFEVGAHDVRVGKLDKNKPIQTFHPVFVYENLRYSTIGQMADVHINSRQQILKRCRAKVIEHEDFTKSIGEMINISSRNVFELLKKFGAGDSEVDVIVISGDLVDYHCNAILTEDEFDENQTVEEIWDLVDMNKKKLHYRDWVDLLALYSIVLDFYRDHAKPIFVVTGNHDCYYEPFAISPRVGNIRANATVPADHNLTIYESILCFGPTYHVKPESHYFKSGHCSSFWKEKFSWFYTVFTPFSDFLVHLPRQNLVGLGWGPTEDMITATYGQGMGHLPRAYDSLSKPQLRLLDSAVKDETRKTIVTSHFTFVNYDFPLTNQMALEGKLGDKGRVYFRVPKLRVFAQADTGTFEQNRKTLYKKILLGRKIQMALSGHSHRRGLYTIRKQAGPRSLDTGYYDFPSFAGGKPDKVRTPGQDEFQEVKQEDKNGPWVIVCDSGGSISCINQVNEFMGSGREPPSGNRIVFDPDTGEVKELKAVPVLNRRAQPRFVVALDFMDILWEGALRLTRTHIIKSFATEFQKSDQALVFKLKWEKAPGFTQTPKFSEESDLIPNAYGFYVKEVNLYYGSKKKKKFEKVNLVEERREQSVRLPGDSEVKKEIKEQWWLMSIKDSKTFRNEISKKKGRSVFLSMLFDRLDDNPLLKRYDFDTPWTFEVKIRVKTKGRKQCQYVLDRYQNAKAMSKQRSQWREFPDLERFKKMAKEDKWEGWITH
jgi:hypothetical protein